MSNTGNMFCCPGSGFSLRCGYGFSKLYGSKQIRIRNNAITRSMKESRTDLEEKESRRGEELNPRAARPPADPHPLPFNK
jgi:hypothetical protein